jgi:2,4-dienoyl-CoA reductase-like NADH-dependent reductase (Old Yellow Enzyme family)
MHADILFEPLGLGAHHLPNRIVMPGHGYSQTPGIYSAEQIDGWRRVTDVVHARGGRIVLQIVRHGRWSHSAPAFTQGPYETYINPANFRADFAADVPADEAHFMALSQAFTNGANSGQ